EAAHRLLANGERSLGLRDETAGDTSGRHAASISARCAVAGAGSSSVLRAIPRRSLGVVSLPMPPNMLLVVFDTARADAFEPYGAGVGASPAVAQLAVRGSALPTAYAPSNWTLPSHVSMLTGLSARESGLAQAPGGNALNCRPYVEAMGKMLMPEVLRRHGYSTRAVSANGWV